MKYMKISNKIIAREVLWAFSILIITILFYCGLIFRNHFIKVEIKKLESEQSLITKKIDSLIECQLSLQNKKTLFNNLNSLHRKRVSDDVMQQYLDDFCDKFGNKLAIQETIKYKHKMNNLTKKLDNNKEKLLNINNIKYNLYNFLVVLLIAVYPIRISYFSIKWAIKNLY